MAYHYGPPLILRSTVYPGLGERIDAMFRDLGPDMHVSFCPERVAQGHSLREIPQIMSAFDDTGLHIARTIFNRIATQLIEVEPLEAELAKLFCNSYRHPTFAVANQFYMIAGDAGVNFGRNNRFFLGHDPYASRPGFQPLEQVLEQARVLVVDATHSCYRGLRVSPEAIVEDDLITSPHKGRSPAAIAVGRRLRPDGSQCGKNWRYQLLSRVRIRSSGGE